MKTVQVDRRKHLLSFVHISHFPQKRKYTGEAYTVHLRAVAEMADSYGLKMGYEIGLCHDLFEDTTVTQEELFKALISYGYDTQETDFIINAVIELTDVYTHEAHPNLNRLKRKSLEANRMADISENSQSIKYCDLIDNSASILEHEPNFAKVYLREKEQLLSVMNKGDKHLFYKALNQLNLK